MVIRILATSPETSYLKKEIWFDKPNPKIQTSSADLEGKDVRLADQSDYVSHYMPAQEEEYLNPDNYDWDMIKKFWFRAWDMSKQVQIEKTPDNVFKAWSIAENLQPSKFIIAIRDPYAFCNSMIKWHSAAARSCEYWVRCAKRQIENIQTLDCYWTTYERICEDPTGFTEEVVEFAPELGSLKINEKIESRNGLALLLKEDLRDIEKILQENPECVEFFGYKVGQSLAR